MLRVFGRKSFFGIKSMGRRKLLGVRRIGVGGLRLGVGMMCLG